MFTFSFLNINFWKTDFVSLCCILIQSDFFNTYLNTKFMNSRFIKSVNCKSKWVKFQQINTLNCNTLRLSQSSLNKFLKLGQFRKFFFQLLTQIALFSKNQPSFCFIKLTFYYLKNGKVNLIYVMCNLQHVSNNMIFYISIFAAEHFYITTKLKTYKYFYSYLSIQISVAKNFFVKNKFGV